MSANAPGQGPTVAGGIVTLNQPGGNSVAAGGGDLVSSSAGTSNAATTITRRINVKIQGSMSDFAQDGQGCATWRGVDGKQAVIWGLQDLSVGSSISSASPGGGGGISSSVNSATHALSNAVIQKAVLLEHKSNFKVPLGVTINCLPSNEMTGYGEAYCYTVLPESINTVPLRLFEASEQSEDGQRWRREYPKYNASNLEKQGVLETTDCTYAFVHQNHPAVALLRANKDLLGSDIDQQQKIDNEWYKVSSSSNSTCACVCVCCLWLDVPPHTHTHTHTRMYTGPEGDFCYLL